ncbi:MAG: DNA-packaging protein [Caedimonas sp.]|nr:DNA-packaging protein [Caedimonas sp.]
MKESRNLLIKKIKERINQELNDRAGLEKKYRWEINARPSQRLPQGEWHTWFVLAGRGFGKTRTGAETIRQWVHQGQYRRIALVANTESDARDVMVEGESGLLAVHPDRERPLFEPSKRQLRWKNGAVATIYSAENHEKLRGPQFDCAWVDELAKFRMAEKIWEQLHFSLRLGVYPKTIVTTTPRPLPLLRKLLAEEHQGVVVTRGNTFENVNNLSPAFIASVKGKYEGTRVGLQELYGEILDAREGALWTYEILDRQRTSEVPRLARIIVAIDPAVTHHEKSDETGIIVAGLSDKSIAYVLEDLSGKYSPAAWARIAVEAYHRWKADRLVAEVNKGGDLVEKVIRSVDASISYKGLHASRGKMTRAEPVAALYEQGKVFHVQKGLEILETQLCSYSAMTGQKSPDRLDALVWALTELVFNQKTILQPRIWKI